MLTNLLKYIDQQKLFHSDERILLAVSGGVDSMVLVHLFHEAGFNFAIAHCNFQLREADSETDEIFVRNMAEKFKIPVYVKSFETKTHASNHGISIQMAARDLRRDWFNVLLENEEYDFIATGHHLNDSIETVIFNLTKGTGISGLKGITPKRGKYIRPLMFASREMIRDYARENNIKWREDASNSSRKYSRNLIRHNIIPELKKINPNLEETFSYSMEKIEMTERIFKKEINLKKSKLLIADGNGFKIDKAKVKSLDESNIILFEILDDFGFNYHQVKSMLSSFGGQPGKSFFSDGFQLIVDRDYLYITPKSYNKPVEVLISKEELKIKVGSIIISIEKLENEGVKIIGDENTALIDFEKLQFPLTIRSWQHGDQFQPLGMKHKKKLSDFMIDNKIPLNLKRQVLVLCSGSNIAWVIGHRIDDRYKITRQTKIVYKICKRITND